MMEKIDASLLGAGRVNGAPAAGTGVRAGGAASSTAPSSTFADLVRENAAQPAGGLTFSAHALARLQSRNITLTPDQLTRMNDMVARVAQKGGKQALFLSRSQSGADVAMVVSVKNRVVITAVDGASLRDNVFTNIDSAALL